MRVCSVQDCRRKHYALGYCQMHYVRVRERGEPGPADPIVRAHVVRHGTVNEYGNYGCRCDECRSAWSGDMRDRFKRPCANNCGRSAWYRGGRSGVCLTCAGEARRTAQHGTESMYARGCRCDACRAAQNRARAERRRRSKVAS